MKSAKENHSEVKFKVLLCMVILFIYSESVKSQKLTDTIPLHEVRVYGVRNLAQAGLQVNRIDTLALQMMKTQTISELLSFYSPIFIKSYGRGSTASASFRGTAPSHTQLYWNGIKLNSPMRGEVDFSMFPVYFIDDISILPGGSSLQSGSGALGGTVLINNLPDWNCRLNIRYIQTIESFSTSKEYLNVGFGNRKIQFKTRLFSEQSKNDFSYYNYGVLPMYETVQKNAAFNKKGLLQEVYSRLKNHLFSAKVWATRSHRDLPQLMSFEGESRTETQEDQNLRTILSWKYLAEKSKLEWIGGLNFNKLHYFRASSEANFVNFDSQSKESSYTSQFSYDWKPKEAFSFNWALNAAYDRVSVYEQVQKTGYDKDRLSVSLLNAAHCQPLPEVSLSLLIRSELYDSNLIGFIPSLGIEYSPDKKQQNLFKMNLSRNYHQPGLNDLYWIPGGNPNLKPEKGFAADLSYGYSFRNEKTMFSAQATGFASKIDDWIVWQPSASGASYWEASNLRQVMVKGAEFQVSWQSNIANTVLVNLRGNYSYTATSNMDAVPSVDESRGKQLIYIPKNKANIFGEADYRDFYLKIDAPFTGKRYTSSNNVESDYEKVLNPYWLINLSAGKRFNFKPVQVDASLNVENLANTDYMAILWRPMPGRYYSLTIQFQHRR